MISTDMVGVLGLKRQILPALVSMNVRVGHGMGVVGIVKAGQGHSRRHHGAGRHGRTRFSSLFVP